MGQGIGRYRVAQLRSRSDNVFKLLPTAGGCDNFLKRHAVPFRPEKRRTEGPEGAQCVVQCCP